MADNKVSIEIAVEGDAEVKLKRTGDAFTELGDKAEKGLGKAGGAFDVFKGVLEAEAVTKALELVGEAATKLFEIFIVDGVKAAIAQEEAINSLNQALANAGQFSAEASQEFIAFAESMQESTKFSNDAIIKTGALIESLGQLSGESLQEATKAAANLSAALGIDLETAARKVALAAEGDVASLNKFRITVEEGKDGAETFANALEAINSKFGGAAEAQVKTFSGSVAQLRNNWDDLIKIFGQAIIENQTLTFALSEISKIVATFTKELEGNKDGLKTLVGEGILFTIDAIAGLVIVTDTVIRAFNSLLEVAKTSFNGLGAVVTGVLSVFDDSYTASFQKFTNEAERASLAAGRALTEDTKLGKVVELLGDVKGKAEEGFNAMQAGASATVAPVNQAADAVERLNKEQEKQLELAKKLVEESKTKDPAQEFEIRLAALDFALEQEKIKESEHAAALIQITKERDNKIRELQTKRVDDLTNEITFLSKLDAQANADKIASNQKALQQIATAETTNATLRLKIQADLKEKEDKLQLAKVEAVSGALGNIAKLTQTNNKELFAIGKAAAIAQAVVDGILAVQKALASAPPPFNFILAGTVGVATAVNVANIAAQQPPGLAGGIDEVPGTGFADQFPALLAPGERVVPGETNRDLKAFLLEQTGTKELLSAIHDRLGALTTQTVVNIGGKEIVNEIRDQLASGRVLA